MKRFPGWFYEVLGPIYFKWFMEEVIQENPGWSFFGFFFKIFPEYWGGWKTSILKCKNGD